MTTQRLYNCLTSIGTDTIFTLTYHYRGSARTARYSRSVDTRAWNGNGHRWLSLYNHDSQRYEDVPLDLVQTIVIRDRTYYGPLSLTPSQLSDVIDGAGGTIFSVCFVKRTDGATRVMACRTGVTSRLKGGTLGYSPTFHGLRTVYSVNDRAYRSIPLDSVEWVKVRGQVYFGPAHREEEVA